MVWFKVDDRLPNSRKAAKAGVEAIGLWTLAGAWSAGEELDGFVPDYIVSRLAGANGDGLAERLVDAGLWLVDLHEEEAGYRFANWEEYQPTRAQIESKRAASRERMQRVRENKGKGAQAVRASSTETNAGGSHSVITTPDPTRPDPKKTNTAPPVGFAEFWNLYPRKVGKAAAEKAYAKALQSLRRDDTVDAPATVLAGAQAAVDGWQRTGQDPQFIPHPATWLNQGRWADEPTTTTPPPAQVMRTARQCPNEDPHPRHPWDDGRNPHMCLGVTD